MNKGWAIPQTYEVMQGEFPTIDGLCCTRAMNIFSKTGHTFGELAKRSRVGADGAGGPCKKTRAQAM